MSVRASRTLRIGAAALLLLAMPVSVTGCACTTMGYMNVGPIPVVLDGELPDSAGIAACLDAGCTPAGIVEIDGDRLEIPQDPPYRSADAIDPPAVARIVITIRDGATLVDEEFEVRTAQDDPINPCPGEFHYETVTVSFP